jgi:molybdopterin-guanine dinucleotide biosynthesis protein A
MICGLVLAGGRSRRFGAEKAVALLNGEPLIAIAVAKLRASCALVAVSAPAGGAAGQWADARGLDRVADDPALPQGPLAGVLAGLQWAKARGAEHLATVPCDTPFLPQDLVERLAAALDPAHPAAVARTADSPHPLCGVWRTDLDEVFAAALASGRHPPVRDLLARLPTAEVWFEDAGGFLNINTVENFTVAAGRIPPD